MQHYFSMQQKWFCTGGHWNSDSEYVNLIKTNLKVDKYTNRNYHERIMKEVSAYFNDSLV